MNPPHRSAVPAYRKWYFGSGASQSGSTRRVRLSGQPEPDPLPFEAIRIHEERTVGPPSTSADGHSAHGTFTIPEGAEGKKLYGTCSLFLGVDDWGILEVKDSGGKVVAQVDLKENPQTAGEQGGHKYHTGTGGAQLPLRHLQLGSQPDQHRLQSGKRQHLHLQLQHRRGADGTGGQERTRTVSLRGRHVRQQRRNAAFPAAGPVGP